MFIVTDLVSLISVAHLIDSQSHKKESVQWCTVVSKHHVQAISTRQFTRSPQAFIQRHWGFCGYLFSCLLFFIQTSLLVWHSLCQILFILKHLSL